MQAQPASFVFSGQSRRQSLRSTHRNLVRRIICTFSTRDNSWTDGLVARRGSPADRGVIFRSILSEGMNPLGIRTERFLVVEEKDVQSQKNQIVGFGQLRPLSATDLELASVYVAPAYRRRGIASRIVAHLLEEQRRSLHSVSGPKKRRIFCLTVGNESLYSRAGFTRFPLDQNFIWNSDIPCGLRFEMLAGRVVAALVKPQDVLVLLYKILEA
jgi:N-acetylglutamate synthase-like GNAT family acetyltransferase